MTLSLYPTRNMTIKDNDEDWNPIPAIATEKILETVTLDGPIVEPAAGTGIATDVLRQETGQVVIPTDIRDTGIKGLEVADFMSEAMWEIVDHIQPKSLVTLPPYGHYNEFMETIIGYLQHSSIEQALMFGRDIHMHTQRRIELLYTSYMPWDVYHIDKRIPSYHKKTKKLVQSRHDNIWIHFHKDGEQRTDFIFISDEEYKREEKRFGEQLVNSGFELRGE